MGTQLTAWRTQRPDVVSSFGSVVGLCLATASALSLAVGNRLEPWEFVGSYLVLAAVLACFALMFSSDAWPLRAGILVGLIVLAELLGGAEQRSDLDPGFLAYSLLLSATSTIVLPMHRTGGSVAFTAVAFMLVMGHTVGAALAIGVRPAGALIVATTWVIAAAMRLGGPRALALYWNDVDVRQESMAAHIVAQNRRSSAARNARHVHDTTLRALAVLARQGAGMSPDGLSEMLDGGTSPNLPARPGSSSPAEIGSMPGASLSAAQALPCELAERLREIAARRTREGFRVEVHGAGGCLTAPVEAAVLAAVDECIVNAERHAGASQVDVILSRASDNISVVVSDSGRGFDPSLLPTDRLGVRESVLARMRDAGGNARVFSAPGRGTTILLEATAT